MVKLEHEREASVEEARKDDDIDYDGLIQLTKDRIEHERTVLAKNYVILFGTPSLPYPLPTLSFHLDRLGTSCTLFLDHFFGLEAIKTAVYSWM